MTRKRRKATRRHQDEPFQTAAGTRLALGFVLANILALAILGYVLLLLGIASTTTGWGWAIVFTSAMAILPLSVTAAILRIGDYGRRARPAAVAMIATLSMCFTVVATTFILLRIVMPQTVIAANIVAAGLCESLCPVDLYAGYVEDILRTVRSRGIVTPNTESNHSNEI